MATRKTSAARVALTGADILKVDDLPRVFVDTPEWGKGAGVYVRGMTGRELDSYQEFVSGIKTGSGISMDNARARLVSCCAVDEEGNQLFTEKDMEALGAKSGIVLDRIFNVGRKASGMDEASEAETAKNLP